MRLLAEELAHRAIVTALVLGLTGRVKPGVRVVCGELAELAAAGAAAAPEALAPADFVVLTDAGVATDLAAAMQSVRASIGDHGIAALVVASPVTHALVAVAKDDANARAARLRDDAYGSAIAWASLRAEHVLAPAVDRDRLVRVVEAAAAAGLILVEPESIALAPGLGRIRGIRSPRARALLAAVALGAGARPMIFVPSARAPRGALVRLKVDRITDGWVAAGAAPTMSTRSPQSDLVHAALAVLDDAATAGRGPMPFKELLREARDRWSAKARARAAHATPSSGDSSELAAALHHSFVAESVRLYALDPEKPGWALTNLELFSTL